MDYIFIKKFHMNPPDIHLVRSPEIQEKYQKHKKLNKNYENSLRNTIFKKNEKWVIEPNKFPYHFTDQTQHDIIWFQGDIEWDLIKFLFKNEDVVFFENKQQHRSIQSINHVHIFRPRNLL